jgi:DNA-binding NarL/FixJ family response regulator
MFQLVEPGLTQREQQVVELLMQGCENEEIAKEPGIAPRTVKAYFNRMFLGRNCGFE